MVMNTLSIGAVFTPTHWAKFAIETFGLLEKWLDGKRIFDPTMGEGSLLLSLIELGLSKGYALADLPTQHLYGVELNKSYYDAFLQKAEKYSLNPANFWNQDLFFWDIPASASSRFDIILGNPPWQNFVDLPADYKEIAKPLYFKYDLVGKAQDLLWGGSRMDIASLVIQKAIAEHLEEEGEAIFFIPLSLLLNDGANETFRNFKVHQTQYALQVVYDFGAERAFEGVATRYGLAHFKRNLPTHYPIPYYLKVGKVWEKLFAKPLLHRLAPLSVTVGEHENPLDDWKPLTILPTQAPRQGINTCGANDIFFFEECEDFDKENYLLNQKNILPKRFIFPLIMGKNFNATPNTQKKPLKWVLLPYNSKGKCLSMAEIARFPTLLAYFQAHQATLQNRKGTMLQAWIKKGYWWAMLGVGAYNFAPYKVVWEAYGKNTFEPRIFRKRWQANQALQCYIPCEDEATAQKILAYLQNPAIEAYLLSLKMEGTMNWAQVGKIKRLFQY